MSSSNYTISSTLVRYPYKPYPSQIGMIDRVIKALQRNQHCLIESPTGSGKSLALLCAVLAWRENEYGTVERDIMQLYGVNANATVKNSAYLKPPSMPKPSSAKDDVIDLTTDDSFSDLTDEARFINVMPSPNKSSSGQNAPKARVDAHDSQSSPLTEEEIRDKVWEAKKRIPKIYFGTRTHKQLSQLIRELKKTQYANVKMTILASRDQTCINENVRCQPDRGEACRQMLNPNTNYLTGTCPYHAKWKRQFQKPYLLRGALRREQQQCHDSNVSENSCSTWDIEDIVDAGQKHGFCPYFAASNTLLTDANLVFCPYNYIVDPIVRKSVGLDLKEQVIVLDEAHNIEDVCRDAASFVFSSSDLKKAADDFLWAAAAENYGPAKSAKFLEGICLKLVEWLEEITNGSMTLQSHSLQCREWRGHEFIDVLAKLGLLHDAGAKIQEALDEITKYDEDEGGDSRRTGQDGEPVEPATVSAPSLQTVEKIILFLNYFYKTDSADYRICVKQEQIDEREYKQHPPTYQTKVTLNIWCMNPAVAFGDIGQVARSVILASGTLAPMKTFETELGIPFKLQLEAMHVLPKDRMFVASVAKGPSGRNLRVTYQNTSEWAFQDEIGQLIIEVCDTVPFGVLCFFPSYKLLETVCGRWQSTGALQRLATKKVIVIEPKMNESLQTEIQRFYNAVQFPAKHGRTCTGAIFMAVCRGKVSEGLDFADDNARAVITFGIPYPNFNCLEVSHKRDYNNGRVRQGRSTLSGDQWYEIQAYRALNQALGRCLRHRQDWGALILVDERFGSGDGRRYCNGLSRWIRENIRHYNDFGKARSDLDAFTQRLMGDRTIDRSGGQSYQNDVVSMRAAPACTSGTTPLVRMRKTATRYRRRGSSNSPGFDSSPGTGAPF